MQDSARILGSLTLAATLAFAATPANAQAPGSAEPAFTFTSSSAEIVRHRETGLVSWMSGITGEPVARAADSARSMSFTAAATAFLDAQASAFGLQSAGSDLSSMGAKADGLGQTFVRFQQRYRGVPIIGAELNVQLDDARNVISVNGESVGDLALSTDPQVSATNARAIALASTARAHQVAIGELSASTPSLAVHDARIFGGPAAPPRLVWRVDVTSATHRDIRELVLVDAQNSRVAVQFNQQPHAAPPANAKQWVCDAENTTAEYPCTKAFAENNPGGSAIADVKNAFKFAENTYDFYARRFNRNSLNGNGMRLVSTVRRCTPTASCPYANAFWDGEQMAYGQDYASARDVVGHELTHGVTDFTSHLFYYYQSGAINESLSDIFGELIQQSIGAGPSPKWRMGEDLPIGAIRNMQDPPNPPAGNTAQPDKMTSSLWWGSSDDSGGVHINSGVGNKLAFLMTEPGERTFNGKTVKGIGIDRSAAIWYRVDAFILNSGNDYADLANALKLACKNLTGTRPKTQSGNPSPDGKITAANCTQVSNAIAAVELNKQPPYNAIPVEAPVCIGAKVATNKLFENFEGPKNQFKFKWSNGIIWSLWDDYAASNHHAADAYDWDSPLAVSDTNLAQKDTIKIPAGAFLRFAQFFSHRTSYTGAVVEYRIGNGEWKRVTPAMFTHNPYNGTVFAGYSNPLEGDQVFTGFSGGWTSSRINLSSLEGKNVRFRFRVATSIYDGVWWDLDDIRIFTCKANNIASTPAADSEIELTAR